MSIRHSRCSGLLLLGVLSSAIMVEAKAQDLVPGAPLASFGSGGAQAWSFTPAGTLAKEPAVLRVGSSLYIVASTYLPPNVCGQNPCSIQMIKVNPQTGVKDSAYAGIGQRELYPFDQQSHTGHEVVSVVVDPTNTSYFFILRRTFLGSETTQYNLSRLNFDPSISIGIWSQPVLFGDPGGNSVMATHVAVGPSGAPVVVGARTSTGRAAASRWTNAGDPDSTFGQLGVQLFTNAGDPTIFFDVAIQSDNKVVAVGSAAGSGLAVVRYAAGGLDSAFGINGIVTTLNPQGGTWTAYDVGIQLSPLSTGRIVVRAWPDALVRYTSSGALDPLFGTGGIAGMSPEGSKGRMTVGPDGSILLAQGTPNVRLRVFSPGGAADRTFDVDGAVISGSFSQSRVWDLTAATPSLTVFGDDQIGGATGLIKAWAYQYNTGVTSGHTIRLLPYGVDVLATIARYGSATGNVYRSKATDALIASRSYSGTTPISQMITHQTGAVLTAFFGTHQIWRSSSGTNLGGGDPATTVAVYQGGQDVTAMAEYSTGVLIAFTGGSIYYGPSGFDSGWGADTERRFDYGTCTIPCLKPIGLLSYRSGVITSFSGPTGVRIYYSADGFNLGQATGNTQLAFSSPDSTQVPTKMIRYRSGVLTALPSGAIWYSPNGLYLGGGGSSTQEYSGTVPVKAMVEFVHPTCSAATGNRCVITAFADGKIYKSKDGHNLGSATGNTVLVYGGSQTIDSMTVAVDVNGVPTKLLAAFNRQSVYASPDGENVGGGGLTQRIYPLP